MTAIGEAVRIHSRENAARQAYRAARAIYLARRWSDPTPELRLRFMLAVVARARWTALAEIIEAEERREAA